MNLLGVDYGSKNIGLAIWREGADVVLPFGVLENNEQAAGKLAVLFGDEKIDKIVLGLPLSLDGKENKNTVRVHSFAGELKASGTAVEFFDERFSSQAADRSAGGASRDEKAAMLILEDYLKKFTPPYSSPYKGEDN
ncbi:Holliday junction resolvase RuvX [Patescibacteria group bacterium]|nr:MAG: Holliday junction resolvase RuvX [Patescibacteria group bacterium]